MAQSLLLDQLVAAVVDILLSALALLIALVESFSGAPVEPIGGVE